MLDERHHFALNVVCPYVLTHSIYIRVYMALYVTHSIYYALPLD